MYWINRPLRQAKVYQHFSWWSGGQKCYQVPLEILDKLTLCQFYQSLDILTPLLSRNIMEIWLNSKILPISKNCEPTPDLKNIRPGMPCLHDNPFMEFWHVISVIVFMKMDPEMYPQLEPTFILPKFRTRTPKKGTMRLSWVEFRYVST